LLTTLLLPLLLAACSTVPYSERTRVILLSEDSENQMGEEAYAELTGKVALSQDAEKVAMLERVGRKIAAVSDRDDFAWEFRLIDDPKTVNAFCLPGGKVAFYTGILPICKDETGIAVVMGHEVAHAVARHGGERVSQSMVIQLGAAVLAAAVSKGGSETQGAVLALYGIGTSVAFALPFSRSHETEADYIGLILMAKAGYDPREAPKFWERMNTGGEQPPEWISTHPSHETRIEDLNSRIPEAMQYYQATTGDAQDYTTRTLRSD